MVNPKPPPRLLTTAIVLLGETAIVTLPSARLGRLLWLPGSRNLLVLPRFAAGLAGAAGWITTRR